MHVQYFYWELPCDHHDLDRPSPLLSFIKVTGQVPGILVHPDLGIHCLADWQQRWEVLESRLWCEGSAYKPETVLSLYFTTAKTNIEPIRFTALTLFAGKNILWFDAEVGNYRFVVDDRYCIANEKNHDLLLKLFPTYSI